MAQAEWFLVATVDHSSVRMVVELLCWTVVVFPAAFRTSSRAGTCSWSAQRALAQHPPHSITPGWPAHQEAAAGTQRLTGACWWQRAEPLRCCRDRSSVHQGRAGCAASDSRERRSLMCQLGSGPPGVHCPGRHRSHGHGQLKQRSAISMHSADYRPAAAGSSLFTDQC